MTLEACLARIAQDWETLTPSTRIHARYHALDGSEAIYGSDPTSVGLDMVADRGFAFDVGSRTTIEESADDLVRCVYQVVATLIASVGEIGHRDASESLAADIRQLARAVEDRSTWPAGVLEVLTGAAEINEPEDDSGLASATLELMLFVEEE